MSKAHPAEGSIAATDRPLGIPPRPATHDPGTWLSVAHVAIEIALAAVEQGRLGAAAVSLQQTLDDVLAAESDEVLDLGHAISALAEELLFVHALREDEPAAEQVLARCRRVLATLGSDA